MLTQERLQSLQHRKALLAKKIESEERSPSSDTTVLRHLKKQKLELKEIIAGVRSDNGHH